MDPLTEFFYLTFQIFYVVGMIFSFTGIPLFIWFWKRMLPKPARTFFWASRRHTPPILLVHDSGRGEFTTIMERKGEGIVRTKEGIYKILPRVMQRLPLGAKMPTTPNPVNPEQPTQEKEESKSLAGKIRSVMSIELLKEKFILDYSDWILKRCMLVGMNMPIFIGYTGKLCLLNPEALALYEMGEMMVKTEDKTLFNPQEIEGKKMSKKETLQPLLLLDGRKIQQIIFNGFDQSQIAAVVADTEELMRVGKGLSGKMIGILVVLVMIALLGVGMFLLPQIMPQLAGFLRGIRQ